MWKNQHSIFYQLTREKNKVWRPNNSISKRAWKWKLRLWFRRRIRFSSRMQNEEGRRGDRARYYLKKKFLRFVVRASIHVMVPDTTFINCALAIRRRMAEPRVIRCQLLVGSSSEWLGRLSDVGFIHDRSQWIEVTPSFKLNSSSSNKFILLLKYMEWSTHNKTKKLFFIF